MSARDIFAQLGFVMISLGAVFATWALFTGPLGKITGLTPKAKAKPRARKRKPPAKPEADR